MFLSSKLNTNPQFPLEMCVCTCTCAGVCVCVLMKTFIVTEFQQSSCGKNACDERAIIEQHVNKAQILYNRQGAAQTAVVIK